MNRNSNVYKFVSKVKEGVWINKIKVYKRVAARKPRRDVDSTRQKLSSRIVRAVFQGRVELEKREPRGVHVVSTQRGLEPSNAHARFIRRRLDSVRQWWSSSQLSRCCRCRPRRRAAAPRQANSRVDAVLRHQRISTSVAVALRACVRSIGVQVRGRLASIE